jgi:hypothetical protein
MNDERLKNLRRLQVSTQKMLKQAQGLVAGSLNLLIFVPKFHRIVRVK